MLGKLSVPGHPLIWIIIGQGPIALAVGAVGVVLTFFSRLAFLFSFPRAAQYRLKYCIKGLLNPKQPTSQPQWIIMSRAISDKVYNFHILSPLELTTITIQSILNL